jgi:Protein of unknown function (DUF1579)
MKRTSIRLIGILLFTTAAFAQMGPPKPTPELKKLDYFLGNWTSEGEAKPGPMGPGGKFTESAHGEWMDGSFFLVIHSDFKGGAMGNATGMAYMGYNADEKVYTYDAFSSMGENIHAKGTLDGDTWNWTNEFKMGAQTMKSRYTMKILSPDSYTFKFEMSPDGTKWESGMEGKATKSK